jgi:hypothetical protein
MWHSIWRGVAFPNTGAKKAATKASISEEYPIA